MPQSRRSKASGAQRQNRRSGFPEEKQALLALPVSPFDGYPESVSRVSPQLLISFDRNRYRVDAMAVGKTVSVRACANCINIVMNGTVVGIHRRHLGRDKVIYDQGIT